MEFWRARLLVFSLAAQAWSGLNSWETDLNPSEVIYAVKLLGP